jgi:predicted amidohydrolase
MSLAKVYNDNKYPFEQEFKGKKIALTICEDIWNLGNNPLYRICPMDKLMEQQPNLMINISASPFDYTHDDQRKATIKANVVKYQLPIFYCNGVGSQTEVVFDGASMVYDKNANLCGQLPKFEEALQSFTLSDDGLIDAAIIETSSHWTDKVILPSSLDEQRNIDQAKGRAGRAGKPGTWRMVSYGRKLSEKPDVIYSKKSTCENGQAARLAPYLSSFTESSV